MILGHWACAEIARRTIFRTETLSFLVIAAFLPDVIDKMANALFSMPGRGVGHSLLFFLAVMAAGRLIGPRLGIDPKILFPVAVLWVTHLVGDLVVPKVLFWPFLGPLDPGDRFGFLMSCHNLYVLRLWPEMLALDLACVAGAMTVGLVQWSGFMPVRVVNVHTKARIHRSDAESTPKK